jgi:uncharacterized protein YjbI with pentapeptide repeats
VLYVAAQRYFYLGPKPELLDSEEHRAQEEALQAYLDQMANLIVDHKLRKQDATSEVHTLARARTATVIQRLDARRNRNVLRFLNEARLTGYLQPSISLLRTANLQGADLEGVNLSNIDLSGANLGGANLSSANLSSANLSSADLSGANLSGAHLRRANLFEAKLNGADLSDTNLNEALLEQAYLKEANLIGANLDGANLIGANLNEANLRGAIGVTNEQLERQIYSLERATMPDGQKYEDLLENGGLWGPRGPS